MESCGTASPEREQRESAPMPISSAAGVAAADGGVLARAVAAVAVRCGGTQSVAGG